MDLKDSKPRGSSVVNFTAPYTFAKFAELGWPDLIPVIPPQAKMHPDSRIREGGKSPGRKVGERWTGFGKWTEAPFNSAIAREWDKWGANIGLRCSRVAALDCDITDEKLAQSLHAAVCALDARLKGDRRRYGAFPKWTWLFRVTEPVGSWRVRFRTPTGVVHGVEVLGQGRQTVICGVHPKTLRPYAWAASPVRKPFEEFLQLVRPEFITKVQGAVLDWIGRQSFEIVQEGHAGGTRKGPPPDQAGLLGEREHVLEAIEMVPNTFEYDDWIAFMLAVRAASWGTAWEQEALEAMVEFAERCERQEGADRETVEYKWQSFKPPFWLGADYVYGVAQNFGWNRAVADAALRETPEAQRAKAVRAAQEAAQEAQALLEGLGEGTGGSAVLTGAQGLLGGLAGTADGLEVSSDAAVRQVQLAAEMSVFSDQAVALRFVERYRDQLLFAGERGYWYRWDGRRWAIDATKRAVAEKVREFVLADAQRLCSSAGLADDAKQKIRSVAGGAEKVRNVRALVEPAMTVSVQTFDRDPWVLNTPSGPIDLRSGRVSPWERSQRLTRLTGAGVAPEGTQPARWLRFLDEVTQGDAELVQWLQRAVGYTLAGVLREHVLFFLYGPGGNGKSVFLNVLRAVLGDYGTEAAAAAFLQRKFAEHSTVVASLAGFRMVHVPEVGAGEQWNEGLLKAFSAGDPIKARFMHRDEFEFRPQGTLWFAGNDRPKLNRVDAAMERRFRLITFDYQPPKPDPMLETRLVEQEGPAILRWAIEGCLAWQREGLGTAGAVQRSTEEYFSEHDPIRSWIEQECERDPYTVCAASVLWLNFQAWQKAHITTAEDIVATDQAFFKRLKRVPGIVAVRDAGRARREYRGLKPRISGVG